MKLTDIERWNTALMIAIGNLEEPDADTRSAVFASDVSVEFFEVRQRLLEYAHTLLAFDTEL